MRLYDTARREVVVFDPPPTVSMYVCGITPYDSTHLGHAFTYLLHDLVIRRLEDLGHQVHMVRNITDVDDSILPKARELGIHFLELAAGEIARFHRDLVALDMRPAIAEPRATEAIDDMIPLLERLRDQGHTYTVEGITWFDVSTYPEFGSLSGLTTEEMIVLSAERGGTPDDPRQRNPLDFILWQPSAEDEPVWDSPFGPGRPGWHIECSAMSAATLGQPIDLHGGGGDLVFPHHECELAQTEAATGEPFVKHWIHGGLVAYHGEKMSKSLGNLVFVSDLDEVGDARAIRLALLAHHYRADFEWRDSEFDQAMDLLDLLVAAAAGEVAERSTEGPMLAAVRTALDDDLDTVTALEVLRSAVGPDAPILDPAGRADLRSASALVGVRLETPVHRNDPKDEE
ncbi:MAG: cysteine--tRNA ligase [Actinomycetia bacterium]|nr:cysteine--tRNA ligase [Actinomycetes bacterium]